MSFFELVTTVAALAAVAYTITTVVRLLVQWRIALRTRGVSTSALEERLTRLEASVEGLSAEAQRLSDGHRFFTQLLTDRRAALRSGAAPESSAPPQNGRP